MEPLDIATSHASGEEEIEAIFDHLRGKAKRYKDAGEGASNRSNKKKNKQRRESLLMATANRKGGRKPAEGTPDHFEKLLEGPCSNHAFPIKHLYKDCVLMKRFLSRGSNNGEHRKEPKPTTDNAEGKDIGFPILDGYLMIFGGSAAYESKRCQKLARREIYAAEPAMPSFIWRSQSTITLHRSDHLESILQQGRYPLVVDPIVGTKRLTKVLMDGGSGLNLMSAEMLDVMGID